MFPILRKIFPHSGLRVHQGLHVFKPMEYLYLKKLKFLSCCVLSQSYIHGVTEHYFSLGNKRVWNPFHLLEICNKSELQKRFYAKGKNRGKDGKSSGKSNITDKELAELINVEDYKKDLDNILENLKEEYLTSLSLRSSIGSLENLPVELDGEKFPLSEIAQVIRKSSTMVTINVTAFPQATSNIKKAIDESGMNLNPQQEGTTFYILIPKVTKEHRESLAQNAKTMCEKTKTSMKDVQNKFIKKLKLKNGTVSEDFIFQAQIKIRELSQESCSQAENLMKNKQNELLKLTK